MWEIGKSDQEVNFIPDRKRKYITFYVREELIYWRYAIYEF